MPLLLFLLFVFWMPDASCQDVPASPAYEYVFDDMDDEYMLASYFFTTREKQVARALKGENRSRFMGKFWKLLDPNPVSEENEFLMVLRSRIDYANQTFGGFRAGWKTDQGRIYVKYGPPYDILEGETQGTNYISKEYHIWKYRIHNQFTYIFVDTATSGDMRLIYSRGDETEGSLADWQRYIGPDFDMSLLY